MKVVVVLVLCLAGVAVGAPPVTQHHQTQDEAKGAKDQQGRLLSAASNLAVEFEKAIAKRVKDHDITRRFDLMMILHLLGFSDEDILNQLHILENAAAELMSELSMEEKLKLENAGMEFVMMVNNKNFRLDAGLSDLITIKSVLYPHLSPANQMVLDRLEEVITRLLKLFGYM